MELYNHLVYSAECCPVLPAIKLHQISLFTMFGVCMQKVGNCLGTSNYPQTPLLTAKVLFLIIFWNFSIPHAADTAGGCRTVEMCFESTAVSTGFAWAALHTEACLERQRHTAGCCCCTEQVPPESTVGNVSTETTFGADRLKNFYQSTAAYSGLHPENTAVL